jgi:peptidoglycan/xylan/chitin deacetylase (PgdA/CDA1 family)
MRIMLASLCVACALVTGLSRPNAQETCAPNTLGVARVAEVDTTGGPWFGMPHGDPDFLAPGEVVLTFDDGPHPRYTRPILAALAAQCTKATFFLVGEMVAEHPGIVKEMADQGHTLGTHTWTHPNLRRLPDDKAQAQIESTFTAAEKAAGKPIAPFFRYPFLSDRDSIVTYLKSRNIGQFAIDIDSFDWRTRDPRSIVHRVMSGLERRGRGIVLMHDIHASTMRAVPELLAQLKAKGYRIVHMRPRTTLQVLVEFQPPVKDAKHAVSKASPATTPRQRVRHRTVRARAS